METKQDFSYGVIPLWKEKGELNIFVLHQRSHRGDVYWTFPKGHKEEGELPLETAKRELKEETSLEIGTLLTEETFDQQYSFVHAGTLVEKKVSYYLAWIESPEYKLQPIETVGGKWCLLNEADKLLTHDNAKAMLEKVVSFLEIAKIL